VSKEIPHTKFIDINTASQIANKCDEIPKVKNQKSHMKESYTLLKNSTDYNEPEMYEKLFNFKKENAAFVTDEKTAWGLYSPLAEQKKIKENKFARHFSLYDHKTHQFIATIQTFTHNGLIYVSDLVIKKENQNQGMSQAFLSLVFDELKKEYPNAN